MKEYFPNITWLDWIVACLLGFLLSVDWAEVFIP